jgi:tetratricopeptide (TPR) repeat protein
MDVRGIYLRGNEAFSAGNYPEALQLFLSILGRDNEDENLLLKISQCYQELDKYDEAIEFLEKLLQLNIERGNYKKGIAVCKRILTIDPEDTEVIVKLANIFRKLSQYGEASYYYRIAAQHYEYAGFMDKAIEMLQIVKELGQEGVEDLLEIIKNEYKRGAKTKASRNIEQIIKDLKDGSEYGLLDVALNLALSNTPDAFLYVEDLSGLYFRTGRLVDCIKLCLWGLSLKPSSATMFYMIAKSLWALGHDDLARTLCEAISRGEITIDNEEYISRVDHILRHMKSMEKNTLSIMDSDNKDEDVQMESLSYLEREQFTNIMHEQLEKKVLREELDQKLKEATEDKTQVIDLKRKSKFSPKVLDGLRESEILMSEGFYDKAAVKLFSLLKEEPGNEDIKSMLNRAMKLSDDIGPTVLPPNIKQDKRTIEEISSSLEDYLSNDTDDITFIDKDLIKKFNEKLQEGSLLHDYELNFDLGIAYMEMELWEDAVDSFDKVLKYFKDDHGHNKAVEARIYRTYSQAMSQDVIELEKIIPLFEQIILLTKDPDLKLNAMYYMADCYEKAGDRVGSLKIYKDIINENPSYRDVKIRAAVLER